MQKQKQQQFANQGNTIVSLPMTQFQMENVRGSLLTKVSWTHHHTQLPDKKLLQQKLRELFAK